MFTKETISPSYSQQLGSSQNEAYKYHESKSTNEHEAYNDYKETK